MRKKVWLNILLLPVCVFISCKQKNTNKTVPQPTVNVVTALQQTVPVYSEYVGQVFGDTDVQIQSRIQGVITGIYFTEGQQVKKGALLYAVDDLSIRTQINGYKANLASAMADLANKKSYLNRVQLLAEMKALSAVDLNNAQASYEVAQNQVAIANAQLQQAQIQLSYTKIKAPFTGVIGISKAQVGDFVGSAGSGSMNTISSLNNIKVRFPIAENQFLEYTKRINEDTAYKNQFLHNPIQLILGDGTVYAATGKLDLANRQVDPSTGSITVQASFPNAQQILKPGQYVKVKFKINDFKNAVIVPQQAVNQMQDIFQVLVLNDSNKIVPRLVTAGQRIGSGWIITNGLQPGEKIAIIGNAFINYNNPVKPVLTNWNLNADTTL